MYLLSLVVVDMLDILDMLDMLDMEFLLATKHSELGISDDFRRGSNSRE